MSQVAVIRHDGTRNVLHREHVDWEDSKNSLEVLYIDSFFKFGAIPTDVNKEVLPHVKIIYIKDIKLLDVAIQIKAFLPSVTTLHIKPEPNANLVLPITPFTVLEIRASPPISTWTHEDNVLRLTEGSLEGIETLGVLGFTILTPTKILLPRDTYFHSVKIDSSLMDYSRVERLWLVNAEVWVKRRALKLDAPNLKDFTFEDFWGLRVTVVHPLRTLEVNLGTDDTKFSLKSLETLVALENVSFVTKLTLNRAPRSIINFDAGLTINIPKTIYYTLFFGKSTENMKEKTLDKITRPGYYTQGREILPSPGGEIEVLGPKGESIGILSRDAMQYSSVWKGVRVLKLTPHVKWNSTAVAFLIQWLNYYVSPSNARLENGTTVVPMLALMRLVYLPDEKPLKILLKTAKQLGIDVFAKEIERLKEPIPRIREKLKTIRHMERKKAKYLKTHHFIE